MVRNAEVVGQRLGKRCFVEFVGLAGKTDGECRGRTAERREIAGIDAAREKSADVGSRFRSPFLKHLLNTGDGLLHRLFFRTERQLEESVSFDIGAAKADKFPRMNAEDTLKEGLIRQGVIECQERPQRIGIQLFIEKQVDRECLDFRRKKERTVGCFTCEVERLDAETVPHEIEAVAVSVTDGQCEGTFQFTEQISPEGLEGIDKKCFIVKPFCSEPCIFEFIADIRRVLNLTVQDDGEAVNGRHLRPITDPAPGDRRVLVRDQAVNIRSAVCDALEHAACACFCVVKRSIAV